MMGNNFDPLKWGPQKMGSEATTCGDVFGFDRDDSSQKMAIQASRCLPAN